MNGSHHLCKPYVLRQVVPEPRVPEGESTVTFRVTAQLWNSQKTPPEDASRFMSEHFCYLAWGHTQTCFKSDQ